MKYLESKLNLRRRRYKMLLLNNTSEGLKTSAQIKEENKVIKNQQLDTLIVEANTVPFDANIQSIGYMSSVLALANFKYNQAVISDVAAVDAYNAVYKTVINWKNANDTISNVQLETVAEALEKAMLEIATIKTSP